MIRVTINEKGGGERVLTFDKDAITIGRSQRNDVILPRSNVSKKHVTVTVQGTSLIIADHNSTNGTFVNGRRLSAPVTIGPKDKVFVSDFVMVMEGVSGGKDLEATFPPPLPRLSPQEIESDDERKEPASARARTMPPDPGDRIAEALDLEPEEIEPLDDELPRQSTPPVEPALREPAPERPPAKRPPHEDRKPVVRKVLPADRAAPARKPAPAPEPRPMPAKPAEAGAAGAEEKRETLREIFKQIDATLDLDRVEPQVFRDQDFQRKTTRIIAETLDAMLDAGRIPQEIEPSQLAERLSAEILGLGPLDRLMGEASILEIIIPSRGEISVRTSDGIRTVADSFMCEKSRVLALRKLRSLVRETPGESSAAFSGTLEGGEEISMIMPPLVLEGGAAVIRRPSPSPGGGIDALVERGILSGAMARFLGCCIEARLGILVCDPGLGSHRSLVPALVSMLEPWERIAAMQCGRMPLYDIDPQLYVALPRGGEESLGIDVSANDLVQVIGAFKPTTLIAGDIRSIDHFRLIRQARSSRAFTLSTIDAESEMDGIARLGGWLAREHSVIPRAVATSIMLDALDIVIFHARMMDGSEKVTRISEIAPGKEGLPALTPVFVYEVQSVTGEGVLEGTFKATRHIPAFMDPRKNRGRGGRFDTSIFQ